MNKTYKIINIDWDIDVEDENEACCIYNNLPHNVEIPGDVNIDSIADWLSDKYGWCIKSFEIVNNTN